MSETKSVGQEAAEKILHECLSAQEWVLMEDVDFNTEKAASIIDKIAAGRGEADTKRLDWLETNYSFRFQRLITGGYEIIDIEGRLLQRGNTLREAIDAAMKGESK